MTVVLGVAGMLGLAVRASQASGSDAPVTLTIQAFIAPEIQGITAATKAYTKLHPNVHFKIEALSQQQSRTTNQALLASSHPPDLGFVQPGEGVYEGLAKNGFLVPMTQLWKQAGFDKHGIGGLKAVYTQSGVLNGVYAAPYNSVDFAMIWYNKDAFAKAGITAPANHQLASVSALDDIASKLKAANYEPMAIAGDDGYNLGFLVCALLGGAATPAQFANLSSNWHGNVPLTTTYTDPNGPFLKVLNAIDDWNKNGVFVDGAVSLQDPQSIALYSSGKAAMFEGGVWSPVGQIQGAGGKFPQDYLLLPSLRGGVTPYDSAPANAYVIPKKSKNIAAAEQFLLYLMSPAGQSTVNKVTGELPSRTDMTAASLKKTLNPYAYEVFSQAAKVGSVPEWDSAVAPSMGQAFEQAQIQKLLTGTSTPAQVAQAYETQLLVERAKK